MIASVNTRPSVFTTLPSNSVHATSAPMAAPGKASSIPSISSDSTIGALLKPMARSVAIS